MMGPAEVARLARLRDRAARDPVDMLEVAEKITTPEYKKRHKARMTGLSVLLPFGFLVTFSIENNHPGGTMRHMSMSSPAVGRLPMSEAVWMTAEALGFVGAIEDCASWIEDLEGHGSAINLVQPVKAGGAIRH